MSTRPLLYLAGPITKPDPLRNVRRALDFAQYLSDEYDVDLFVAHLTCYWDIVCPRPYEEWLRYDFNVIEHCDGLYRMDGESAGADREVEHARSLPIPVFLTVDELQKWRKS